MLPGVLVVVGALLLVGLAFAILLGVRGTSPGKSAFGLRVVNPETGTPIGVGRALLRTVILGAATLPLFGLGTAVLAWTAVEDRGRERRGWHDHKAHSIVVDVRPVEVAAAVAEDERPRHVVNLTAMRLMPVRQSAGPAAPVVPAPAARSTATPRDAGTLEPQPAQPDPFTSAVPAALPADRREPAGPPPSRRRGRAAARRAPVRPAGAPGRRGRPAGRPPADPGAGRRPPSRTPQPAGRHHAAGPLGRASRDHAPAWPSLRRTASAGRTRTTRPPPRDVPPGGWSSTPARASSSRGSAWSAAAPRAGRASRSGTWCRCVSQNMSISKTHAQFHLAGDGALVVMDRGSTNGSILIRRGVSRELSAGRPATLLDGDRVLFGDREMRVAREQA